MDKLTTIVVMAKQPRVGHTKTRLCPPLALEQAAALAEALLKDTLVLVSGIENVQLAIAITPAEAQDYFRRISPPDTLLLPVEGADIGDCLNQATKKLLSMGFIKVIALNADGPSLPKEYLLQAINFLDKSDVVLGPGEDGGYYLIGLKTPRPQLFQHIEWSTAQVYHQTLARGIDLGLKISITPPWYDVDTAAETVRLSKEVQLLPPEHLVHTRRFFEIHPPCKWQTL
jgi:rSAM/selenodomain-associated transferase 1